MAVRDALVTLLQAAKRLGAGAEVRDSLEVALAEALNNIVEHAYRNDPGGWIVVELDLVDGSMACRIWDGGRPMPEERPPRPDAPELGVPLGALPEGGFGWTMIRALSTRLTYERIANRNCLSFAVTGEERAG